MEASDIQKIFEKYGTDKARHKGYAGVYAEIFTQIIPYNILELGGEIYEKYRT